MDMDMLLDTDTSPQTCKVAEAQYAELAATFKNKSAPDSGCFQGQVVNGSSGFGSGLESESEDSS
jgi:hypothetical protein